MGIRTSQPAMNTGTDPAFFVSNGYLGGGSLHLNCQDWALWIKFAFNALVDSIKTAGSLSPAVESAVDSQANDDTYLVGIRFLGNISQLSRSTGPLTPSSAHHPRGNDIGRVGEYDDPSRAWDWELVGHYPA